VNRSSRLQRQPPQEIGAAERVEGFTDRTGAQALDQVRRRAQHELPQHVGDRLQLLRERADGDGVAFAELRHGFLRAAFAGQQIAAVGCG
jgi:hypothetical protein